MIKFNRYSHVNDLLDHYGRILNRPDIQVVIENGLSSSKDAEIFSRFIWEMAGKMNQDEEDGVVVLGSTDNTEMLPDISYEVTKLMKDDGFFNVWQRVSDEEIE